MSKKIKLIAMYFPQLHAIPENDEWWGKGFTDWDNVKKAVPHEKGNYQPRVPKDKNYYDQSKLDTLIWQIELAKTHGLYGFCHYHYWFDGKQLLETPTNLILEHKDIDFPFCLSWANETWSRRWDAQEHQILIQQTHPPTIDSWKKHYDYLIKAWTDPRAIKVDGKPVFVIYRPLRIEKIDEMLAYWRELAIKDGLPGLYFIFQKQYELTKKDCLKSFDATFQFQPFEAIYSKPIGEAVDEAVDEAVMNHSLFYRFFRVWFFINIFRSIYWNALKFKRSLIKRLNWLRLNFINSILSVIPDSLYIGFRAISAQYVHRVKMYDYDEIWKRVVAIRKDVSLTTYPGAFVDWDNTPRYKRRATFFVGASPERFKKWFSILVKTMPSRGLSENFIFMNAWNEWSEGTYLEPDEKYDYQYIEAVRDVLEQG